MVHSRIIGLLDLELSRSLAFSFSIAENLTCAGRNTLRAGDRFRFDVWATNSSGIPLRSLEGTVSPSSLADFAETTVGLERLDPGTRQLLTSIEARILELPKRSILRFNQIGVVRVSVSPDLSLIRMKKSRRLTFQQTA